MGSDSLTLSGGVQGTGTLTVGGEGGAFINGNIAAGAVLAYKPVQGSGGTLTQRVDFSGRRGPARCWCRGQRSRYRAAWRGTGGIDVQNNGVLKAVGLPSYSGTVTLETGGGNRRDGKRRGPGNRAAPSAARRQRFSYPLRDGRRRGHLVQSFVLRLLGASLYVDVPSCWVAR